MTGPREHPRTRHVDPARKRWAGVHQVSRAAVLSLLIACPGICLAERTSIRFLTLPGGTFKMGSERFHQEESAAHLVTLSPFSIGATEVTNAQFAEFVAATGYVTTAERGLPARDYPDVPDALRKPGSMVFAAPGSIGDAPDPESSDWWRYVAGASWRHPQGPGSSIEALDQHPVVQVSGEDATAFAQWAGGRLPTEAEWEYAARGGLEDADYSWGDHYDPREGWKANTWQGAFPNTDLAEDGHHGTAPVRSYPANGYGLYDVAGNVWEHVSDWWQPGHSGRTARDPQGPARQVAARYAHPAVGAMTTIKGGSWLCAPKHCLRYRPSARQPSEVGLGSNHIGFRVVRDVASAPPAKPRTNAAGQ